MGFSSGFSSGRGFSPPEKVITFIIPDTVLEGEQEPHIIFPFDGDIIFSSAFLRDESVGKVKIDIEKSSDYKNWESIFKDLLEIDDENHFSDDTYVIDEDNKSVKKTDVFRVNVKQIADGAMNLTINLGIKV